MSTTVERPPDATAERYRPGQTEVVAAAFVGLILAQDRLVALLDDERLRSWSTMFVALTIQALPFLVMGVLLAAAISTFVSVRLVRKVLPRQPLAAVPVAGLAGIALPGCECGSVPISGSLIRRGVAPAAAFAFLLAAPAINPIVLASTAVAFPGQPEIVGARFTASLFVAVLMGWIWTVLGKRVPLRLPRHSVDETGSRLVAFLRNAQHDFMHSAGFLVLGGAIAATVNTFVPRSLVDGVAEQFLLSVVVLAVFAVVVAMCSEADAFVAASLTAFSDTAKLAFMVVGPAVDVKLAAMQVGNFGRGFTMVFAPLTFVVAVVCALVAAVVWL